jgi:hypothetical protein
VISRSYSFGSTQSKRRASRSALDIEHRLVRATHVDRANDEILRSTGVCSLREATSYASIDPSLDRTSSNGVIRFLLSLSVPTHDKRPCSPFVLPNAEHCSFLSTVIEISLHKRSQSNSRTRSILTLCLHRGLARSLSRCVFVDNRSSFYLNRKKGARRTEIFAYF